MEKPEWRGFYSKEAEGYERRRYRSRYGRLFRDLHRDLIGDILSQAGPVRRALDVASGTGQLIPPLEKSSQLLVACDLTLEMLEVARRNYGNDGVTYCLSDAGHLPFPDKSFDIVASSRFLHLFDSKTQLILIAEMARVLAPEGLLIIDFYHVFPRRLLAPFIWMYRKAARRRQENDSYTSIGQAKEMLRSLGLDIKSVNGVGSYLLASVLMGPYSWQRRIAHLFSDSLMLMAEQFVVVASKA